jgi:membrane-bound lytic murein transglycosylase D
MRRFAVFTGVMLCAVSWATPLQASDAVALTVRLPLPMVAPLLDPASLPDPRLVSGLDIYQRFRDGLADPQCASGTRWQQHFMNAPARLARSDDDLLPLFGYVVEALRDAQLPTEYALIPFVESGYKPAARSASGPAGLWQFIGTTARNHGIEIGGGYDGRLSPVDSTRAAVQYLKKLHGMFGGDWRLAVMGYNAGEYRILQSMRKAGMNAQNAQPAKLPGLSRITYSYVEKLHALACLLQQAPERELWLDQIDRSVPVLEAQRLPSGVRSLDAWATAQGHDPALLRRLNPALASGLKRGGKPVRVLAPMSSLASAAQAGLATRTAPAVSLPADKEVAGEPTAPRFHTVRRGESAWTIARRHGLTSEQLLTRNQLNGSSVLQPGMVLRLVETAD